MDSGQRQPRGLELDLNYVAAAGSVVAGASVVVGESKEGGVTASHFWRLISNAVT
jgi:hypothetical protein